MNYSTVKYAQKKKCLGDKKGNTSMAWGTMDWLETVEGIWVQGEAKDGEREGYCLDELMKEK